MKKSVFASVKPLAMATAVAAGASVSMIAVALPGGDTSGAAGVVTETLCHNPATMTITSGVRNVTTTTGACQVRTLPPTKGLVLNESASSSSNVTDSSALVNAGGELYETYVGGDRKGVVLLTPNRALAVTRSSSFASGADGAVNFDLGAAVQPASGLQSAWLTGTYNVMNRVHDFQDPASNLTTSPYATPNRALGERNYTSSMKVTFNGDGTCDIDNWDQHHSFTLTKDPMMAVFGEMDNGCTTGGGQCGQSDGNNYVSMGNVNLGSTGSQVNYADWGDANADDNYSQGSASGDCTYSVNSGVVSVTYNTDLVMGGSVDNSTSWTVDYNVSSDLRYLVAAEPGVESHLGGYNGEDMGATLAVGVRTGSGNVEGKTYLYNATSTTNSVSTSNTPSYENPATPTYQTEECITRGSIAFGSTDLGGGFKDCTVDSVSSCAGRKLSGYEESSNGAADGTVTDNITVADGADTAPTACRWKNTSGLVVEMDVTDPDNQAITVTYSGDVADNSEALVLQGSYAVVGTAPDVQNSPLLPQMKYNIVSYVVGQQYQGSLAGDADSDSTSNWNEFTWAADVTPSSGSIKNDFNGSGLSDVLFLNTSTGGSMYTEGAVKANATYPGTYNTAYTYQLSGDFDGDGSSDALFYNTTTGGTMIWPGMVKANATYPGSIGTGYVAAAACDLTADGSDDIVWRNASSNVVWPNAVKANATYPGSQGTSYAVAACADFDANGLADIFWRDNTSGANEIWNGGVKANKTFPGAWTDVTFSVIGAGDVDGDAEADLLFWKASTGSTVVWNSGLKANASYPGAWADATWSPVTLADYAGDGYADIYWRKSDTGGQALWPNAVKANATYPGVISTSYASQK